MITFYEAYEIDCRVYYGESITPGEKKAVTELMSDIIDNPDNYPFSYLMWVAFSIKDYPDA